MADDQILHILQSALSQKKSEQHVSTLARRGNDEFVQEFLTDNVTVESSGPFAIRSQLYVASFWGIKDVVQQLLEAGANPSLQNDNTLWTPLHAATFQEHGPDNIMERLTDGTGDDESAVVVMLLLEHGGQPELPDAEDRTPADFASVSDKIWPFFAALDISRTPKMILMKKGILRPSSGLQARQPVHDIDMANYKPSRRRHESNENNLMAAMSGDVLADEDEFHSGRSAAAMHSGTQPQYSLWK